MAGAVGETREEGLVGQARECGFLTRSQSKGKAGGTLTQKALEAAQKLCAI